MNGCVIPRTPIAVDCWRPAVYKDSRVFFLTHMHADHTSGLTPTWNLPIYCSPLTKKLLLHKFSIKEKYIHELEVNERHIVKLDGEGAVTMTVTLIDANHCPGSVMFLFDGYFGRILYTGDFRADPEMFIDNPLENIKNIDTLYLDNTYSSPGCEFLSREEASIEICKIIHRNKDKKIVIGVRELGKEDLLIHLARTFETWVTVSKRYYDTLQVLGAPNVFTTNRSEGAIVTVPLVRISRKSLASWNSLGPCIAILPTALFSGTDAKPFCREPNAFIVPYSDHSSFSELQNFVKKIKPKHVIPIVKATNRGVFGTDISDRANMTCFDPFLDPTPSSPFSIPPCLLRCRPQSRFKTQSSSHPRKKYSFKKQPLCLQSSEVRGVQFDDSCVDSEQIQISKKVKRKGEKCDASASVGDAADTFSNADVLYKVLQIRSRPEIEQGNKKRKLYSVPIEPVTPGSLAKPFISEVTEESVIKSSESNNSPNKEIPQMTPVIFYQSKTKTSESAPIPSRAPQWKDSSKTKTAEMFCRTRVKRSHVLPYVQRRDEQMRKRKFHMYAKKLLKHSS